MPHVSLVVASAYQSKLFCTAALLLGLLALSFSATDVSAQATTYEARVIENRIQVRSGAGRAYYEVGELQRGDRVTVQDEIFGWYRIAPPEGVFCFVERKNVDAKNDGSRGVVNTDKTTIYAAHTTKGPADSYRPLLKLDRGDTVEIVDTVSNAYKIRPPAGASVYLPQSSLEPVGDEPAVAETTGGSSTESAASEIEAVVAESAEPPSAPITRAERQSTQNALATPETSTPRGDGPSDRVDPPPTTEVAFTSESPASAEATDRRDAAVSSLMPSSEALLNDPDVRVARPDVPVSTRADNDMLRAVEVAILPYFSLPVDQQPIAKMVRGYADAAQIDDLSDNDLSIIRNRLTELQRNRQIASGQVEPSPASSPAASTTVTANTTDTAASPTTSDGVAVDSTSTTSAATVALASPDPTHETSVTTAAGPDTQGPATDTTTAEAGSAPDAGETVTVNAATPPAAAAPAPAASVAAAPSVSTGPAFAGEYDAIGMLVASTVHTGVNQPKLLRLMDPTGRRTVAYLEPPADLDTLPYFGQLVGIAGEAIYDPTTKLNLIRPVQIDILAPR